MKKIIKIFSILVLMVLAGAFLALAYTGFVPGVSALFVKQVDLGVVADPQLVAEINEQVGHEVLLPDSQIYEPSYEGEIELDGSYSSQQVTSVLASWSQNYSITPFYNVQVKIHDDGTAEGSGMLKVQEAISLAKQLGYSDEQISQASKYATYINADLPVYVKGSAGVSNNQVSVSTSTIRIGNVTVPADIVGPLTGAVEDAVERKLNQVPSVNIQKMDLSGGKLNLQGKVPQVEKAN